MSLCSSVCSDNTDHWFWCGTCDCKSTASEDGLSIPRLELVSGHMAFNLITNARDTLKGFPIGELHCWLDSTVALHWIKGAGEYK